MGTGPRGWRDNALLKWANNECVTPGSNPPSQQKATIVTWWSRKDLQRAFLSSGLDTPLTESKTGHVCEKITQAEATQHGYKGTEEMGWNKGLTTYRAEQGIPTWADGTPSCREGRPDTWVAQEGRATLHPAQRMQQWAQEDFLRLWKLMEFFQLCFEFTWNPWLLFFFLSNFSL